MYKYKKVQHNDDNPSGENLSQLPDSGDDSRRMCTNVGRVQLSINHPSGKTSLDRAGGSSTGSQMKLDHNTNASKNMEYSLKREEINKEKTDDENAIEVDSNVMIFTKSCYSSLPDFKIFFYFLEIQLSAAFWRLVD